MDITKISARQAELVNEVLPGSSRAGEPASSLLWLGAKMAIQGDLSLRPISRLVSRGDIWEAEVRALERGPVEFGGGPTRGRLG